MANSELKFAVSTLVVFLWPPVVGAAFSWLGPETLPAGLAYPALALVLVPGVVALWWVCPIKWQWKAALTVPYLLLMCALLFVIALQSTCARFGNCF